MKTHFTVVTRKGQITVPADVRRALNIQIGDTVRVEIDGEHATLTPTRSRLAAGFMSLPPLASAYALEEMQEIAAEERAREIEERSK